jgi:hypothetical protein
VAGPAVGDDGDMDVDDQAGEAPNSELPDDDAAGVDGPAQSDGPSIIEAVVYGPLGLVLEARTLMPRLVQRGRSEVAMAKMVGQFAVRKGTEDLAAGALVGQEKILGVLRGTRLFGASGASTPTSEASPGAHEGPVAAAPPSPSRVSATAAEQAAGIDPADLAIVGYDLLSASQVVPRLESLTATELELVARYEAGTRGRKTILAKVSQLQSAASPDQ